jgi:predicted metal-binding membrane protein
VYTPAGCNWSLLIWTLFGGLSYLGALAASELAQQFPWIMMNAARIGGGILLLAGIYQLTSLKRVCIAMRAHQAPPLWTGLDG